MTTSVAILRFRAHRDIDFAAGQARLKYITDIPGQQAVYMTKLQEAEAYAAAFALDEEATAPPYIAAEAASTGATAIATAEMVIGLAAQWNGVLGPAIEGARMGGKTAVTAAETAEAIEAARAVALAALELL